MTSSSEPRNPYIIRASEIGSFLYCQRAWGYEREGKTSANQPELLAGTTLHEQHGRKVLTAVVLRSLGYLLLLIALVLGTVTLLGALIP